jgi:hypothetical protein
MEDESRSEPDGMDCINEWWALRGVLGLIEGYSCENAESCSKSCTIHVYLTIYAKLKTTTLTPYQMCCIGPVP